MLNSMNLWSVMIFAAVVRSRVTAAWTTIHTAAVHHRQFRSSSVLYERGEATVDEFGRRIRRRLDDNSVNDESDDWNVAPFDDNDDFPPHHNKPAKTNDGWDDFDPFTTRSARNPKPRQRHQQRPFSPERGGDRTWDRKSNRGGGGGGGGPGRGRFNSRKDTSESPERKINMKALEGAGFVHLYGLSSTLNALQANRRDFRRPEDRIDLDALQGEELEHEQKQRDRKPEAQFSPWLFLQEQRGEGRRQTSKAIQGEKVKMYAEQRGIPIAYVDKGALNTLSGNRPHQGYVLRCGKLDYEPLTALPHPNDKQDKDSPRLWLALDEVVDPQNLGALLRSAYFLGGGGGGDGEDATASKVGVLVCSKNSAPPSPVVSASSAGALELMKISSTSNLPRTLAQAESDGWRVIGASSSIPKNLEEVKLYDLQDLAPLDPQQPTILVLGSEGHGLRNLVATACTEFVRIPGGGVESMDDESENEDEVAGVDSLNVSVTGGILLWHLMRGQSSTS